MGLSNLDEPKFHNGILLREIFYHSLRENEYLTFEAIFSEALTAVAEEYAVDFLNEALVTRNTLAVYDMKRFTVEESQEFEIAFVEKVSKAVKSEVKRIESSFVKGEAEEAKLDLLLLAHRLIELIKVNCLDDDFLDFFILSLI